MKIIRAKQIKFLHREKIERKRFHYILVIVTGLLQFYKFYVLHKRTLEGILSRSCAVTVKKCGKSVLHVH